MCWRHLRTMRSLRSPKAVIGHALSVYSQMRHSQSPLYSIVAEAQQLAEEGVKELILHAGFSCYGEDPERAIRWLTSCASFPTEGIEARDVQYPTHTAMRFWMYRRRAESGSILICHCSTPRKSTQTDEVRQSPKPERLIQRAPSRTGYCGAHNFITGFRVRLMDFEELLALSERRIRSRWRFPYSMKKERLHSNFDKVDPRIAKQRRRRLMKRTGAHIAAEEQIRLARSFLCFAG